MSVWDFLAPAIGYVAGGPIGAIGASVIASNVQKGNGDNSEKEGGALAAHIAQMQQGEPYTPYNPNARLSADDAARLRADQDELNRQLAEAQSRVITGEGPEAEIARTQQAATISRINKQREELGKVASAAIRPSDIDIARALGQVDQARARDLESRAALNAQAQSINQSPLASQALYRDAIGDVRAQAASLAASTRGGVDPGTARAALRAQNTAQQDVAHRMAAAAASEQLGRQKAVADIYSSNRTGDLNRLGRETGLELGGQDLGLKYTALGEDSNQAATKFDIDRDKILSDLLLGKKNLDDQKTKQDRDFVGGWFDRIVGAGEAAAGAKAKGLF